MVPLGREKERCFLFLQGPHGPFFHQLAKSLRHAGATTWRVGFNAGDAVFWPNRKTYLPYKDTPDAWSETFRNLLSEKSVTDVVLYNDTRPIHAQAIEIARAATVRIHIFEEGYLRPYWVSYEHEGSNGNSALMTLSIEDMQTQRRAHPAERPVPPSHWGDMRQHVFYGALYHWFVMFWNQGYRHFKPHRALAVTQEFQLYFKRLLLMPLQSIERWFATRRVRYGGFPYHLALLQLEHDSSFQMHGPFETQTEFVKEVLQGFAAGAPAHHHLVFKAHPLENGRTPLRSDIRRLAREFSLENRVHFVRGGKLAGLLNEARSAVTVNSTAGQQALWRGIPLRSIGEAVYNKPDLVSGQPLAEFFANPTLPNAKSYRIFRNYLLSTSQLPGSFYASRGRHQVVRKVTDMMLEGRDPYTPTASETEALRQQLRVVQ